METKRTRRERSDGSDGCLHERDTSRRTGRADPTWTAGGCRDGLDQALRREPAAGTRHARRTQARDRQRHRNCRAKDRTAHQGHRREVEADGERRR
eukprot:scaffold1401_cov330-Pavlova_lutheri.AAC.27